MPAASAAGSLQRDETTGSLMPPRALPGECVTNDYDNASEAIEVQPYRDFGSGSQRRDPVDPGRRPHSVERDWSMMMHCARSCTVHLQLSDIFTAPIQSDSESETASTPLLRHGKNGKCRDLTCSSKADKISLVYRTNQTEKMKRAKQKKNLCAIKSGNGHKNP